jgi:hypothetical protein
MRPTAFHLHFSAVVRRSIHYVPPQVVGVRKYRSTPIGRPERRPRLR